MRLLEDLRSGQLLGISGEKRGRYANESTSMGHFSLGNELLYTNYLDLTFRLYYVIAAVMDKIRYSGHEADVLLTHIPVVNMKWQ